MKSNIVFTLFSAILLASSFLVCHANDSESEAEPGPEKLCEEFKEQAGNWSQRHSTATENSTQTLVDRLGYVSSALGYYMCVFAQDQVTDYLKDVPQNLSDIFSKSQNITEEKSYEVVSELYNISIDFLMQSLFTLHSAEEKITLLKLFGQTVTSSAYLLKVKFGKGCISPKTDTNVIWESFNNSMSGMIRLLNQYLTVHVESDQPLTNVTGPMQSVVDQLDEDMKKARRPQKDLMCSSKNLFLTMMSTVEKTSEQQKVSKNMTEASDSILTYFVDTLPGFGINVEPNASIASDFDKESFI